MLNDLHINLGAKLVDFAGFEMPIQYQNLKEEVNAVRSGCGIFDVSHMGEFFVTGKEAIKFVDHLLTNDFLNAEMGKAVYSPLCNESGMIIDDLIAYKLGAEDVMICVNASNIEKDFTWMQSHIKGFDAKIKDQSNDYSLLAIQGPASVECLMKVASELNVDSLNYYDAKRATSDSSIIIARTGYTGEDGFEIFASHDFIRSLWTSLVESTTASPCGLGARDVLRLEVCYPLYGHELDDTVTPLDSGLKWCTKLNKDSFIGKEALLSYEPKYQSIKLVLEKGIPREGYEVTNQDDELIGKITSGTMSVSLKKGIAFARISKEKLDTTNEFYVNIRDKKYNATRVMKAFVQGGHK